LSDYAMLVDSNFGINKANYFLKRSLNLDVVINDDLSLAHKLEATYTNTAVSNTWPAGPYKSYTRLYLPQGSIVSSVKVAGERLKSEDIDLSSEHGKTVAGFLLRVPLNSEVKLEVEYQTLDKLAKLKPGYSLYWQKQSGTSADPLNIHLTYPTSLTPKLVSPRGDYQEGTLDFALSNVTDRRITIKFD